MTCCGGSRNKIDNKFLASFNHKMPVKPIRRHDIKPISVRNTIGDTLQKQIDHNSRERISGINICPICKGKLRVIMSGVGLKVKKYCISCNKTYV